jgi:hypothetical protein
VSFLAHEEVCRFELVALRDKREYYEDLIGRLR